MVVASPPCRNGRCLTILVFAINSRGKMAPEVPAYSAAILTIGAGAMGASFSRIRLRRLPRFVSRQAIRSICTATARLGGGVFRLTDLQVFGLACRGKFGGKLGGKTGNQ